MHNPWARLPTSPPFVLPEDRARIESFDRTAKPRHFIHLESMPEPFLGRPDAPVVLLNLNPGHEAEDARWHTDAAFVANSRRNLLHGQLAHPFHLLDPSCPSPGRGWWTRKLRALIQETSLDLVSSNLLCVEFFPYHSFRFAHRRLRVPSQTYSHELVRRAISRGAMVVAMRSFRLWFDAIPELAHYANLHRVNNVQNPAISPRNLPTSFAALAKTVLGPNAPAT